MPSSDPRLCWPAETYDEHGQDCLAGAEAALSTAVANMNMPLYLLLHDVAFLLPLIMILVYASATAPSGRLIDFRPPSLSPLRTLLAETKFGRSGGKELY